MWDVCEKKSAAARKIYRAEAQIFVETELGAVESKIECRDLGCSYWEFQRLH